MSRNASAGTGAEIRAIGAGLSQKGVRNYNERLILSLLQRHGEAPGSDLARRSGLSAPTISAILRSLEGDGLLERGDPVRGRVGKPSVPMRLAPEGVLSIGLKIGRRSADLLLLDFAGVIWAQTRITYDHPLPDEIFAFAANGLAEFARGLRPEQAARICGIGVAAPFEMWNRVSLDGTRGAPREAVFRVWQKVSIAERIAAMSPLPVMVMNDATAACQAEHVYGRGRGWRDYAYFYVGAFVGGGVVLNNSVYEGRFHNAGALGSLRSIGPNGAALQLADTASLHLLEGRLAEVGIDPRRLWDLPQDWRDYTRYVEPWLGQTAQELARACLSTCSVIDFEAVIIDGAFPADVRDDLVERTRRYLATQDVRGLIAPQIEPGSIGGNARAIGAASSPIFSQFLLDTNAGMHVA